ncbi:hypothetical protein [Ktedonospora formicarum]|uniref:Uncharacterized protein n=1 Tax=Ktedonospora formicarum TaxID=2778364 RepID=A0A8J3MSD1_9CHLR|nr:hypothetical protein [Ktedonospora formicarum]GHO45985.1 hypothetical protein KSX_41480 [Ktedonospora formicarum]
MDHIRRLLWRYLGITLDRKTKLVASIVILGIGGVIGFGIGFAVTHASFFLFMTLVCGSVAGLFGIGGSYNAMDWGLSSKEERRRIEEEIALKQMRRRARDKHFEP